MTEPPLSASLVCVEEARRACAHIQLTTQGMTCPFGFAPIVEASNMQAIKDANMSRRPMIRRG